MKIRKKNDLKQIKKKLNILNNKKNWRDNLGNIHLQYYGFLVLF